jgi:SAM-dependent methyltransferase
MLRAVVWDRLRRLAPYPVRRWIKRQGWFRPVSARVFGHRVYSRSYYADIDRLEAASVEHIAEWIGAQVRPKRVLDVGCGSGLLMAALHRRGIEVYGVDISREGIALVRRRGLRGEVFDLSKAARPLPGTPYDLALSCEVAEHLEARHATLFADRLAAAAPLIYLTAAEPDPAMGPGLHHFNEQPNEYWIALLRQRGAELDSALTQDARSFLAGREVISYLRRPMIFRRAR